VGGHDASRWYVSSDGDFKEVVGGMSNNNGDSLFRRVGPSLSSPLARLDHRVVVGGVW
jgi:hypothetical protein